MIISYSGRSTSQGILSYLIEYFMLNIMKGGNCYRFSSGRKEEIEKNKKGIS